MVSVLFPLSSSASYPAALAVARGASRYAEGTVGRRVVHLAEFSHSPSQAGVAVALLRYVASWRGVQVFVAGRPVGAAFGSLENVERVLRCYTEAGACNDRRAHCMSFEANPYTDPVPSDPDPVLFPCRHVLRVYPRPLSVDHPASIADQAQARAVDAGCEWCPLFSVEALATKKFKQFPN